MRCTRIEFKGYQRLADTACNISGKLTAFIGPNEAGKTTVLKGLEWLSDHERGELASRHRTRREIAGAEDNDGASVKAWFHLDPDDLTAIGEQHPAADVSYTFTIEADAGGKTFTGISPRIARARNPAIPALRALADVVRKYREDDPEDEYPVVPQARSFLEATKDQQHDWSQEQIDEAKAVVAWLKEDQPFADAEPSNNGLGDLIQASIEEFEDDHPNDAARHILYSRRPRFALFGDLDRQLSESYSLDQVRRAAPPALDNLVAVAGLDLVALWRAVQSEDTSLRNRLLRNAERQIRERLAPYWSQTQIALHLTTNGDQLEIAIEDESGTPARFSDRSEGLKTFVTLVAFIARQDHEVPPILLIDEAETHLHLDAQGDLIKALQQQTAASQVLYTTHSPGCLPTDLGTGIRLVKRHATNESSELINNLWHESEPGSFSPLLYAMGAGAAAFGACRWAVVTEGVTDMMLLPSLIRLATGETDLIYHVAPGLVSTIGANLIAEQTATKVIYLVDGDDAGSEYKDRLAELKIPRKRMKSHPKGMTLEDLIHPDLYIEAINKVRNFQGLEPITLPSDDRFPVVAAAKIAMGTSASRFAKADVAAELLEHPERLRLSTKGAAYLKRLHKGLMEHFDPKR